MRGACSLGYVPSLDFGKKPTSCDIVGVTRCRHNDVGRARTSLFQDHNCECICTGTIRAGDEVGLARARLA